MLFIPVMGDGKVEFSASLFIVTWSFRNHSDLLLMKHLLWSMLKTVVLRHILVET